MTRSASTGLGNGTSLNAPLLIGPSDCSAPLEDPPKTRDEHKQRQERAHQVCSTETTGYREQGKNVRSTPVPECSVSIHAPHGTEARKATVIKGTVWRSKELPHIWMPLANKPKHRLMQQQCHEPTNNQSSEEDR
jgi:hypothetical protein